MGSFDSKNKHVRNAQNKSDRDPFSLAKSFGCAFSGIAWTFTSQRNFKIQLSAALFVVLLGCIVGIDIMCWIAVLVCIGAVLASECMNTALESVVDLVSPDYHELARRAKDCAAGSVLVWSIISIVVGLLVFIPHILLLFKF